jgi:hypothetical protein
VLTAVIHNPYKLLEAGMTLRDNIKRKGPNSSNNGISFGLLKERDDGLERLIVGHKNGSQIVEGTCKERRKKFDRVWKIYSNVLASILLQMFTD